MLANLFEVRLWCENLSIRFCGYDLFIKVMSARGLYPALTIKSTALLSKRISYFVSGSALNTTIVEYTFETFGSYMEHFCYMSYSLYKDKYIDALDLFLYTIFHDIYNAENESIEDMASYCYFKNETPSGRNISKIVESIDQIHLFSAIFSELFK